MQRSQRFLETTYKGAGNRMPHSSIYSLRIDSELERFIFFRWITSKLSERPLKLADQKLERGKVLNPEYSICRDQPTSQASPLRINDLLSAACFVVTFLGVCRITLGFQDYCPQLVGNGVDNKHLVVFVDDITIHFVNLK